MNTFITICITLLAVALAGFGSGGFYFLAVFWLYFIAILSVMTLLACMANEEMEARIRKEYRRDKIWHDRLFLVLDITIIAFLVFHGFILLPIVWLVSVILLQALKIDWREKRKRQAFQVWVKDANKNNVPESDLPEWMRDND